MRIRFQPWQLAVVVIALCLCVIGVLRWRRIAQHYDASQMLAALPLNGATLFYIDVAALRESGFLDALAGSKTVEEPDYRNFVDQTGFDYRTDLDAVAGASFKDSTYFAIRGHFEWKQLAAYARSQGGACRYTECTLPGTSPEKNISFYPLKSDVLALAVSPDQRGMNMITPGQSKLVSGLPSEPVWISMPSRALKETKAIPSQLQLLLETVAKAESLTLAIGPRGNGAGGTLQIRAEIACATPESAATLVRDLKSLTDELRKIALVQGSPRQSTDIASVLLGGTFEQKQSTALATWPLDRRLIQSLTGSQTP